MSCVCYTDVVRVEIADSVCRILCMCSQKYVHLQERYAEFLQSLESVFQREVDVKVTWNVYVETLRTHHRNYSQFHDIYRSAPMFEARQGFGYAMDRKFWDNINKTLEQRFEMRGCNSYCCTIVFFWVALVFLILVVVAGDICFIVLQFQFAVDSKLTHVVLSSVVITLNFVGWIVTTALILSLSIGVFHDKKTKLMQTYKEEIQYLKEIRPQPEVMEDVYIVPGFFFDLLLMKDDFLSLLHHS